MWKVEMVDTSGFKQTCFEAQNSQVARPYLQITGRGEVDSNYTYGHRYYMINVLIM